MVSTCTFDYLSHLFFKDSDVVDDFDCDSSSDLARNLVTGTRKDSTPGLSNRIEFSQVYDTFTGWCTQAAV